MAKGISKGYAEVKEIAHEQDKALWEAMREAMVEANRKRSERMPTHPCMPRCALTPCSSRAT